ERHRTEAEFARAEALTETHRYADAIEEFARLRPALHSIGLPELELRALTGEAWARIQSGELRDALGLLLEGREVAEGDRFSDVDRAEVLFRLGVCRYKLSSISPPIRPFRQALTPPHPSQL